MRELTVLALTKELARFIEKELMPKAAERLKLYTRGGRVANRLVELQKVLINLASDLDSDQPKKYNRKTAISVLPRERPNNPVFFLKVQLQEKEPVFATRPLTDEESIKVLTL